MPSSGAGVFRSGLSDHTTWQNLNEKIPIAKYH